MLQEPLMLSSRNCKLTQALLSRVTQLRDTLDEIERSLKKKQPVYLVILSLSVLLLFSRALPAEPMRVAENLRREAVLLPSSAPDKDQLILVSFVTITYEAEIIAVLAVFNDPQTKRPVDYLELYDGSGGLLLVSWVDRFGIRRMAMDRGLLQEEASRLEGILVLLAEGIPS